MTVESLLVAVHYISRKWDSLHSAMMQRMAFCQPIASRLPRRIGMATECVS